MCVDLLYFLSEKTDFGRILGTVEERTKEEESLRKKETKRKSERHGKQTSLTSSRRHLVLGIGTQLKKL